MKILLLASALLLTGCTLSYSTAFSICLPFTECVDQVKPDDDGENNIK